MIEIVEKRLLDQHLESGSMSRKDRGDHFCRALNHVSEIWRAPSITKNEAKNPIIQMNIISKARHVASIQIS